MNGVREPRNAASINSLGGERIENFEQTTTEAIAVDLATVVLCEASDGF